VMAAKSVQRELTKMGRRSSTVATDVTLGTGVHNLTRALAQEWGPHGITVNAVAQGWMEYTPAIGNPDPSANQTVRFVPMKRAGAADELAPLAVYLASDACGYISGQVLYVDGGLLTHL